MFFATRLFNLLICIVLVFTLLACDMRTVRDREPLDRCVDGGLNILLYVSDDHSQDTGAYGNPVVRTPNLDALAAGGILFPFAFATTASCSASRSVILSGLHNHRTGQYGHTHDYNHFYSFDHIQSVSGLLAQNGYRTGRSGKYHVAPEAVYPFEYVLPGGQANPVLMAESSREFLSADERPFFLLMATSDPHRGGGRDEQWSYNPDRFGNIPGGHEGIDPVVYSPDEVVVPPWLPDNEATRQEIAQYYQSVSRLDQGFGRMMDILKEKGLYDQTLIIYLSDHGMAFPGAKTTVYEPGLLSPLIVRDPCLERSGLVNEAMISWVDITPTILDYADIEFPQYSRHIGQAVIARSYPEYHGLHGRSFRSILAEENPPGWDRIYASHTFHEIHMFYPMRVVRDRNFKLIWNIAHGIPYPFASDLKTSATWQHASRQGPNASFGVRTVHEYIHRPEFELYDMQNDPYESRNLSDNPDYSGVLEAYVEKIKEFQRQTGDPWYIHWVYRDGPQHVYQEGPEFQ